MILLSLIFAHLLLLVNLKFTAWPEMLLWPYLITKGYLPYVNIAIAHTPHLLIHLALIYKIFGVGIMQLKISTWILIIATDIILFLVVKKIWNKKTADFAVFAYIIWQLFFDGNGLWFDLMLTPVALISFYLINRKKYFLSGIIWVCMLFTKQTAFWFLIPIIIEIFQTGKVRKVNLILFGLGISLTGLVFMFGLFLWGVFPDFINWAVKFGIFILPKSNGQILLPSLKNILVSVFPFLIFIPPIFDKKAKNKNLLIWVIAGGLGAYPRFEYFHFQPALPFLAMVTSEFFTKEFWKKPITKTFTVFYVIGCIYLFSGFFMRNFNEGVRFYESEVQNISTYIKANTEKDDKIFVMNWWDSAYAFSDRMPGVNLFVPQLPWYQEIPGVQENEVAELNLLRPKIVLIKPYSAVGLSAYKPAKVYGYVLENYKLKERINGIDVFIIKK